MSICPHCMKEIPDSSSLRWKGAWFCPACSMLSEEELFSLCPVCNRRFTAIEGCAVNGVRQCRSCADFLKRQAPLQRVHLDWRDRPYTVRGSAPEEAELFAVTLYADRVEIAWEYTVFSPSPERQVSGTEVLPADYFATHTLPDFLDYLDAQPWGAPFFYIVGRDARFVSLFTKLK